MPLRRGRDQTRMTRYPKDRAHSRSRIVRRRTNGPTERIGANRSSDCASNREQEGQSELLGKKGRTVSPAAKTQAKARTSPNGRRRQAPRGKRRQTTRSVSGTTTLL